jgi:hypothetical protein
MDLEFSPALAATAIAVLSFSPVALAGQSFPLKRATSQGSEAVSIRLPRAIPKPFGPSGGQPERFQGFRVAAGVYQA